MGHFEKTGLLKLKQRHAMRVKILVLLFSTFASTIRSTEHTQTDVVVDTEYGKILGESNGFVSSFLGIPYAKPPLDELRWKEPEKAKPWKPLVYKAKKLKPGCPQLGCDGLLPEYLCPSKTSESCLYLNVWVPTNVTSLPVIVYIHGGNFVHMSVSSPLFDGTEFARHGYVVLVTFDYRIGALGYLYTGSSGDDAKGNYGIHDQKLALKWVHGNIKNFGGDPTKVTLFGHSSGGQSIPIHLMSSESSAMFRNVIIESAPFPVPFKSPNDALNLSKTMTTILNCTHPKSYMNCLREKSLHEITQATKTIYDNPTSSQILTRYQPFGPIIDDDLVPQQVIDAVQKDSLAKMPTIIGTVSEEARLFVYGTWREALADAGNTSVLLQLFPNYLDQVVAMYGNADTNDNRDILSRIGTDFVFTCATRNMSRTFANHYQNVFVFVFNQSFSSNVWGDGLSFCNDHVCHGGEIAYVFDSGSSAGFNFNVQEDMLASQMVYYWANFAYTSDPNRGPHESNVVTQWPVYESSDQYMAFQTRTNTIVQSYKKAACDFWDARGYKI